MTQPFMPIRLAVKGSIHPPAGTVERYLKMWTSARGRGGLAPLQSKTKASINYIWNAARLSQHCNQMGPPREKKTLHRITCAADRALAIEGSFFFDSLWHYSCWQAIVRLYLKTSSLLLLFYFQQNAYMAVCLFFYHQNQPRNRFFLCFIYAFCLHTHSNKFIILYNSSACTLEIFKSTGSSLKLLANYMSNLGNSW